MKLTAYQARVLSAVINHPTFSMPFESLITATRPHGPGSVGRLTQTVDALARAGLLRWNHGSLTPITKRPRRCGSTTMPPADPARPGPAAPPEGLRSCPFCGGTDIAIVGRTHVQAKCCGCGSFSGMHGVPEAAVAAWNKRAGQSAPTFLLEGISADLLRQHAESACAGSIITLPHPSGDASKPGFTLAPEVIHRKHGTVVPRRLIGDAIDCADAPSSPSPAASTDREGITDAMVASALDAANENPDASDTERMRAALAAGFARRSGEGEG